MRNQLFEPVSVDKQTIYWEAYSGFALGVQKYTKTYVSGGYGSAPAFSRIETIIELSIQQDDRTEIQMTLKGEEMRVRDGQRVSGILGYTENKRECWLIFVNHDDKKWYWISTPRSFFKSLGLFVFLSDWWVVLFIAILAISIILVNFFMYHSIRPVWAAIGIILGIILGIVGIVGIIFCVVHFKIQRHRVHLAWKIIKSQLAHKINFF